MLDKNVFNNLGKKIILFIQYTMFVKYLSSYNLIQYLTNMINEQLIKCWIKRRIHVEANLVHLKGTAW